MTEIPDIVFYGASNHALTMALDGRHRLRPRPLCRIVACIDDFAGGKGIVVDDAPVILFEEWKRKYTALPILLAVGDSAGRRKLAARVREAGGGFARLYDAADIAFPHVSLGDGCMIAATSDIGGRTSLGEHVMVMPMCWIAHDVTIGDFATLAASCSISGHVKIEDDVFLGAGCVVVNGSPDRPLVIGRGARVAAGAVVTKSVAPGASVAGNPARSLRDLAARARQ